MLRRILGLSLLCLVSITTICAAQLKPPVAPVRPVNDTYFGTTVVDPYRWMEAGGPELLDYMKAENAVTEEALHLFATQNADFVEEMTRAADAAAEVRAISRTLDQYFYLETPPGKRDARLMVRAVAGGEPRLLLDPATMAEGGKHAAIDYYAPSPDAAYAVVGVSLGGSENSVLRVLEVATGKLFPEAISRSQDASPSWTDDSKGFYFSRMQPMAKGAPASAKFDNIRVYFHRPGTAESADVPIFGPDVTTGLGLPKYGNVRAQVVRGTQILLGAQSAGAVETDAYWVRRADGGSWVKVVDHKDGVLALETHGSRAYAITKGGAKGPVSNGRVVSFDLAKEGIGAAHEVVPESDFILSSQSGSGIAAAADALYVHGSKDGIAGLIRVPYDNETERAPLTLPVTGAVTEITTDVRRPGATIVMEGWTNPRTAYAFSPEGGKFVDTEVQPPNPLDTSGITSKEVLAKSADGTTIPLSILYRKDVALDGSHPALLVAYGAYGIAIPAHFDPLVLPWLRRGGIFAWAHVRGGGERGEAWHLAGNKTTKQHTIDDFVASAQYLIDQKYTSPARLSIEGTSAGGIAVGGFLTQHPELVSAVLYRVGITDILRSEQRSTGGMNVSEYGTVKNEAEFRAMYAISPYAHVQDGARYPAVMLETGANDPRVTSWMLTKMTARLQAANASSNPILLRVDFDAGHGIGSDRAQAIKLRADEYTFVGWRLGMAGFIATRKISVENSSSR